MQDVPFNCEQFDETTLYALCFDDIGPIKN